MSTPNWKSYKLDELLKYEQPSSYIVHSTNYDDSFPTPVLTAGKSFIIGYTNEEDGIYSNLPVLIFDDFTTSSQYVNFPFKVKSSAMKILTPNANLVHPKFIYYRLQTINFDASTHKRYWIQTYSKIKVKIPPLEIQERIVGKIEELFSEIDNAVSSLKAAKQKLTAYRQSILKEAFQGNLSKSWRSLHTSPSFAELRELVNEQKQEAGNKKKYKFDRGFPLCSLPSGWGWIPLGEAIKGVEYGSAQKSNKSGQIPVLRMGNIQNGQIDWSDLVFTSDQAEIEKYHLKGNDVLFNRTNSPAWVGKTAIYNGERPAIFAGYLIRINYLPIINPHYLTYYLNSHTAKKYSNLVKTDGVNQSNISGSKLCTYPFPMTSSAEQVEIVSLLNRRLSICDSLEDAIYKALQESVALKQSILQKAFEGDLV